MSHSRKSTFKLPPAARRESLVPQEVRRNKALEEQKRRRAQQVESNRQFDLFAHLSINDESDSDGALEDAESSAPATASAALGPYVSMLNDPTYETQVVTQRSGDVEPPDSMGPPAVAESTAGTSSGAAPSKKKSKKRNKKKNNYNKPSKWADQCMYAELLEMATEDPLWSTGSLEEDDSLPRDLETGWVAVAPVPVGKRCLVVTHQTAGTSGTSANTTVRSRLLGKSLIPRFPSPLPPMTVLDCILDANWRQNGIVHVLDVVRWKGQDIADCEAPFRFWWRDTRLGELPRTLPPTVNFFSKNPKAENSCSPEQAKGPHFPYPTYFLPIPYHTNTSLASLNTEIVPSARSIRSVTIELPTWKNPAMDNAAQWPSSEVDMSNGVPSSSFTFTNTLYPSVVMSPSPVTIEPDGLLLYIAAASYEPGTGPLSSWVPITGYNTPGSMEGPSHPRPLDLFQRLIQRRLHRRQEQAGTISTDTQDVSMDVELTA